jgi:hypothetical protein
VALAAWWLDRRDDARSVVRATSAEIADAAGGLRSRLALSNHESAAFLELLGRREELLSGFDALSKSAQVRIVARRGFDEAIAVLSGEAPAEAARFLRRADEICPDRRLPAPMVDGNDLAAAGLRPGPVFRGILDAALDRQIEVGFADRAEALGFALALAGRSV